MDDKQEIRHLLALVQSHLDTQDIQIKSVDYDVDSHVATDDVFKVEGQTVRAEFEYTYEYDED